MSTIHPVPRQDESRRTRNAAEPTGSCEQLFATLAVLFVLTLALALQSL